MKKWSIIGVVVTAIVCLMMLAACAGGDEPAAPQVPVGATPGPAGGVADPPVYEGHTSGFAFSELEVLVFDRGNPGGTLPTDNFYTNWIQERVLEDLNMGVTFRAVGRFTEQEEITGLLATGNTPDLNFTFAAGMVQHFAAQGGIANLAPYLERHLEEDLPYLNSFLGDVGLIWRNQDPVTGNLFSLNQRRMMIARNGVVIRGDWLDALGLEPPDTTESYLNALRAFRDHNPGNVSHVIPLSMTSDVRWRASAILESFVDPNLSDRELFRYSTVGRYELLPGVVEGARLLNYMYHNALLDRDFALLTGEAADERVMNGLVGSLIGSWDWVYRPMPGITQTLQEIVPGAHFIAIDPFRNPISGQTQKFSYDPGGLTIFVPANSQNVLGALRYLDWLSRFENHNFLQIGLEGYTHLIEYIDGVPIPVLIANDGEFIMNSPQNLDYTIVVNGLNVGSTELNALARSLAYPGVPPQAIVDAYMAAMENAIMPIIIPGTLPFENSISEVLFNEITRLLTLAMVAPADQFDEVWDRELTFILDNIGAARVFEERDALFMGTLEQED